MRPQVGFVFLTVVWLLAAEAVAQTKPVVVFFATGGTIAMKIDPVKHAPVPAISGEDLLATVPEVSKYAAVEVKNVSNVPSDYMDPVRWIALTREVSAALARPEVAGVIISHGTDTLEETAYFLDLTVDSEKPIVLVGAGDSDAESEERNQGAISYLGFWISDFRFWIGATPTKTTPSWALNLRRCFLKTSSA